MTLFHCTFNREINAKGKSIISPLSIAIARVDYVTIGPDTVNFGSHGDVLVVVDRAGVACGNIASGGGTFSDGGAMTGNETEAIPTTKGGTSTEGSLSAQESPSKASTGFIV